MENDKIKKQRLCTHEWDYYYGQGKYCCKCDKSIYDYIVELEKKVQRIANLVEYSAQGRFIPTLENQNEKDASRTETKNERTLFETSKPRSNEMNDCLCEECIADEKNCTAIKSMIALRTEKRKTNQLEIKMQVKKENLNKAIKTLRFYAKQSNYTTQDMTNFPIVADKGIQARKTLIEVIVGDNKCCICKKPATHISSGLGVRPDAYLCDDDSCYKKLDDSRSERDW